MKTSMGVALFCLLLIGCSTRPSAIPAASTAYTTRAPQLSEAPTGFEANGTAVVGNGVYQADLAKFEEFETVSAGLGPLFNAQSCRECHQSPMTGGVSQVTRSSLSTLGDGFVEAVDDATLVDLSKQQCKQSQGKICGLVLRVPLLESPGETRVGRFGWKNQHASLLSFSGDAYLNEIGITNRLFPDEVTNLCNTVTEPNDRAGADGLESIDHFARFIRATKAPGRDPKQSATTAAKAGEALFAKLGCDICHVHTLTTAAAGTVINGGKFAIPEALGSKTFHPYGDFLLHDIGTGDGIVTAMEEHYGKRMYQIQWRGLSLEAYRAIANRIRTAPLWGVRMRPSLMHDGASLTFRDAILRHRGEAKGVTARFEKLGHADQDAIIEFLKSL